MTSPILRLAGQSFSKWENAVVCSVSLAEGGTMKANIQIIDRGRGLQLSTSRITVQDLVPYFHEGWSHEEIMRWIPSLTAEEITVVQCYYLQHKKDLDDQDRRIRE